MAEEDAGGGNAPTNLRTFLVLEEVARAGVPVTPTEVNASLGLPKPTIHRLFATLEAEGLLQREIDGRSYTPGRRLSRLAMNIQSSLSERTPRIAVLKALAEEIGETCNIALPDRDAMIYLDRVETKWPLRIQLPVGTHVPFHCTASGKMYLSSLSDTQLDRYLNAADLAPYTPMTITDRGRLRDVLMQIRERGYSQDDHEFMEGMIAIARPILGEDGRLASTVSFHAPSIRLSLADAHKHLDRLGKAALELSQLVRG
ncbi:MAG: IclR family transcriptional regulator [Pseudomonadota bacterium]